MDKEIERSFSQVLARGKYMHSIVFHEVKPDMVDEYVDLVGKWYPRMANKAENKVHLVGSWRTEVGDCDTFGMNLVAHLIAYSKYSRCCSPHLGVPALPGVSRFAPCHPASPRLPRIRPQAQDNDQFQEVLSYAGVFFLANHLATPTWRCF